MKQPSSKHSQKGQSDLFASTQQHIDMVDGELDFYPDFLSDAEQREWFQRLQTELAWRQDQLRFGGRVIDVPRLQAWYGEPNTHYTYSGLRMEPLPWSPSLAELKQRIEQLSGAAFNSVLANYYRDQRDSVSWHADDEPELGRNPVIASVSLGETRVFHLRHKQRKDLETVKLPLHGGSLLIMKGSTQHHWKHQIPKSKQIMGGRINLTFRWVHGDAAS